MSITHTDPTGTNEGPKSEPRPAKKKKAKGNKGKKTMRADEERVPFPRLIKSASDTRKERVARESGAYDVGDCFGTGLTGNTQAPLAEIIAQTLAGESHVVAGHFLENALDYLARDLDCLHHALSGDFALDREDAAGIAYRLSVRARAIAEIHERLHVAEQLRTDTEGAA